MYFVVEFKDGVQLVPYNWMNFEDLSCRWPPSKTNKEFTKLAKNYQQAGSFWKTFRVLKILGKAETYDRGLEKLKQAEMESDLSTDNESALDTIRKRRIMVNSDDEPDGLLASSPLSARKKSSVIESDDEPEDMLSSSLLLSAQKKSVIESDDEQQSNTSVLPHFPPIVIDIAAEKNKAQNSSPKPNYDDLKLCMNRKFTEIKFAMEKILENQEEILNKLGNNFRASSPTTTIDVDSDFIELPFHTIKDLENYDEKLQEKSFFSSQVKRLRKLGGVTVKAATLSLLEYLLTLEVANEYSFYGFKKKKNFSDLHLKKLIIEVIQNHHSNATNAEIAKFVMKWLSHASEKIKKKQAKQQEVDKTVFE